MARAGMAGLEGGEAVLSLQEWGQWERSVSSAIDGVSCIVLEQKVAHAGRWWPRCESQESGVWWHYEFFSATC